MTYTSVVSSKGQVTIPEEIRTRLGLREGDRLEFVADRDRAVIRTARTVTNPFEAYVGALGTLPGGKGAIKAWVADLRDEDRPTSRYERAFPRLYLVS